MRVTMSSSAHPGPVLRGPLDLGSSVGGSAATYNTLLQPNFDAYDLIDALPDHLPRELPTHADTAEREENKFGAWYVKSTITALPKAS